MFCVFFRRKKIKGIKTQTFKWETSCSDISGNTGIPFSQNVVLNMSRKLEYFYQIFQEYESMFLWGTVLPCRLDVHVMDLGIFCSWGFFKWKISLFCSCALCGTTGAFWMCFYYQNNLLSENIFRCCSQAVGLSQKRLKRSSLQFWLYIFFSSAFCHFKWKPLIISFILRASGFPQVWDPEFLCFKINPAIIFLFLKKEIRTGFFPSFNTIYLHEKFSSSSLLNRLALRIKNISLRRNFEEKLLRIFIKCTLGGWKNREKLRSKRRSSSGILT